MELCVAAKWSCNTSQGARDSYVHVCVYVCVCVCVNDPLMSFRNDMHLLKTKHKKNVTKPFPFVVSVGILKRWGSPRRQGLRSHLAHKWATFDCAPPCEAVRIPEAAGVT